MTDADFMRRALFHAARAQGATSPNPLVGAVVVTPDGVVVGQGYHARAGDPHAEVQALAEAGAAARGATLYVTLEPCCHTGRTGPCTRRVIEAGITRVVAAMTDPDPRVNGRGFEALRAHGLAVEVGLGAAEAARLNEPFLTVQRLGRPLVVLKAATSLDGRMAARPGERTELTAGGGRRRAHLLRAASDAIAVGSETLLVDDPLLTVRECWRARPFVRVVFDRRLRTPPSARVFSTLTHGPVIIMTTPEALAGAPARARALEQAGATLVATSGRLRDAVSRLLAWDVSTLLLEGGAAIHAAAWDARLVDRVVWIVASLTLGDPGVRLLDGRQLPRSALAMREVTPLGSDTWMEADVHRHR